MPNNKQYIKKAVIIIILILTVSCSTVRSEKSIKLIDRSVNNIQEQIVEVKNTTDKIKEEIIELKQKQPECNLSSIEQQIELLDILTLGIDNNLSVLKGQVKVTNDMVKMEVKEYRNKYFYAKIFNIILIVIIALLIKIFSKKRI